MTNEDRPEDSESTPNSDASNEGQAKNIEEAEEKDEMTLTQERLEEALREKDQFRSIAQRAQADLINYRKRAADEQKEIRRNANTSLILKVLGIVDDLNRAVDMVPEDAVSPGWMEGLNLVQRNLANVLDSEGVTKIEAEGQPFEPWGHEAVFYQETPDGEHGIVTDVIRDGYKLRDRVIRAAQVVVSKAPEPAQENPETSQPETPDTRAQETQ
ncbi:MAG: nucleotide exchange factor GrpE [Chloroflexi bacterium]|nr:nucleotide exchange factor GrpE [Chloroflexota bacterium]MCI0790704.1 nucleotide exchange factor GrpE [Chloroflexota bacterium]MCI0795805.1 nucleotide exchange factor GrpE [Chloroflexota bacterium]MCI0812783.1 nucleotide exchange factor GrpE [Chloroflexota bacterium]MCI0822088.1 nucleotide exchange factor GrpE [Chloroflexota bacterium]